MKLLGRELSAYAGSLLRLDRHLVHVLLCVWIFRNPVSVIWAYLVRRSPAGCVIALRCGLTLQLSEDPEDVVTVFTIFVRKDYGTVPPRSVVVDIGANIGVFALYAIYCGAKRVYAFEPSARSFECLERNIKANALSDRIFPHRVAVAEVAGNLVRFPRRSSVYNTIIDGAFEGECDDVPTITLDAILDQIGSADVLKIDCEGAELAILRAASASTFRTLSIIRLEYHGRSGCEDRKHEVVSCLAAHGFKLDHVTADNEVGGVGWFTAGRVSQR